MKKLLIGLLFMSSLQIANAASTDTAVVELEQVVGFQPVATIIPVEQKVVEIHMRSAETSIPEKLKKRKVENLPLNAGHATCSGSFITNTGDILTARHCVDGFTGFEVVTADKRKYEAVVVATSPTHDLAIIHIDRRDTPYFRPAATVTRGEKVYVLGSPLGITDTLSTGVVARLDGDIMLVDCSALPGNSGGPVYNEREELIGVLSAGYIVLYGTTHLNVSQGLDAVYFFVGQFFERKYGRN